MLNKEDMIDLIKAVESFNRLNDRVIAMTGGGEICCDEFNGLYKISDVLKRNSRYKEENDKDYDRFLEIIWSKDNSPEEKCSLLM